MAYLELCNRVYSHIQSKDVREYYLNEIKDTIDQNVLFGMIVLGYYDIEDKFIDISDFNKICDKSTDSYDIIHNIVNEFDTVKYGYFNTSDRNMYITNFYINVNSRVCIADEPFYGRSINDIKYKIQCYMSKNGYEYDEYFSRGYIDKINVTLTNNVFIRYIFDVIDGDIVITNGYIYDVMNGKNDHTYNIHELLMCRVQYPFKNGDILKFKTPLMCDYTYGIYKFDPDLSGVPYIWLNDINDIDKPILDLATMDDCIFDGFLMFDWLTLN